MKTAQVLSSLSERNKLVKKLSILRIQQEENEADQLKNLRRLQQLKLFPIFLLLGILIFCWQPLFSYQESSLIWICLSILGTLGIAWISRDYYPIYRASISAQYITLQRKREEIETLAREIAPLEARLKELERIIYSYQIQE